MIEAVHRTIQRLHLISPGDTIIAAVSGGPDSMALLHYLWTFQERHQIKVQACHLHHQLRGEEADGDADFVRDYCENRNIPYYEKRINVKRIAKEKGIGTQLAAREARYEWFKHLLTAVPHSRIATGHHGDDQVETMFMQMIRGSSPLHPYGIPASRKLGNGSIIRPLLEITKEDIEAYCGKFHLTPRYDSSNESNAYTRNRIRHHLLPVLKSENPNIHLHMQRQNEWTQDDQTYLMSMAEEVLPSIIVEKSDQNVTILIDAFLGVAVALQRRLIHLILSYLCGKNSPAITSIHIEQVIALICRKKTTGEHHLSDSFHVRREYDVCHFFYKVEKPAIEQVNVLTIPGQLNFGKWMLEAVVISNDNDYDEKHNQIILDYNEVNEPLIVRNRQKQDTIACRGMEGSKRVQRLFIDRKIPKHERDEWPILAEESGRVLWVPFLHKTRLANVSSSTKHKLIITCHLQEG